MIEIVVSTVIILIILGAIANVSGEDGYKRGVRDERYRYNNLRDILDETLDYKTIKNIKAEELKRWKLYKKI